MPENATASLIRAGETIRGSIIWQLTLGALLFGGLGLLATGISLTVGYLIAISSLIVFVVTDYLSFLAGALSEQDEGQRFSRAYLEYIRQFREGRVIYLDSYSRSVACVVLGLLSPGAFFIPVPLIIRGVIMGIALLIAVLLFSAAPMHAYARIPEE